MNYYLNKNKKKKIRLGKGTNGDWGQSVCKYQTTIYCGKEQKVTWDVLLNTTVPTDSLYQCNKSQLAPLGKPSSFNSQALSQLQLLKNTGEYRHDLG